MLNRQMTNNMRLITYEENTEFDKLNLLGSEMFVVILGSNRHELSG